MAVDPLTRISTKNTPQSEPVPGRSDQVPNSAGGYVFGIDKWKRAQRFLILGTEGGSYYASEKDLTQENARVIFDLANSEDGVKLVEMITEISLAGRAPKQNQTLFALAVCAASTYTHQHGTSPIHWPVRNAAYAAIPKVCRTGTMLFQFHAYANRLRGWSKGYQKAITGWYMDPPVHDVAYQAVKYRSRRFGGPESQPWTHRDMLRLSHPGSNLGRKSVDAPNKPKSLRIYPPAETPRDMLFDWITHGTEPRPDPELRIVEGFLRAQAATDPKTWARLVDEYHLPWEALPDKAMNEPTVWEALLPHTGLTALMRNLPRLTNIGMLQPLSGTLRAVTDRLTDFEQLARSRVHPYNVLTALTTYAAGKSLRGDNSWIPVAQVIDALDVSFYAAFGNVVPAGKRTLIGLDVSGSMGYGEMGPRYISYGSSIPNTFISPRVASCALSMVTARTETDFMITAFTSQTRNMRDSMMLPVTFSPRQRLDDIVRETAKIPMGGTDCALPALFAIKNNIDVETIIIYTDSESWAGKVHPYQALEQLRQKVGHEVRQVVVAMTANEYSVADPRDPFSLDVVGFDGNCPDLISAFSRGEI